MSEAKHSTSPRLCATSDDFRRIFDEEADSLYRPAFLPTANGGKAQPCLVAGLENSVNRSPVFRDWARSWAGRTVIQNALRANNPRPMAKHVHSSFDSDGTTLTAEQVEIAAVLQLEPFKSLVCVMSILARYAHLDGSELLDCARRNSGSCSNGDLS
jgi:hypothetical protein